MLQNEPFYNKNHMFVAMKKWLTLLFPTKIIDSKNHQPFQQN
jgi:hypothetical protein